jgi:hypothetical protein
MQAYTRKATLSDLHIVADNLRPADLAEIKASTPLDPVEALKFGHDYGECRAICTPDDLPVALYGVTPIYEGELASIWMVATNDFHKVQRQFLRQCRDGIQQIGGGYRLLFNLTDARNELHHRWLKWCGFTFINKHENHGHQGRPFYEFVRIMEK